MQYELRLQPMFFWRRLCGPDSHPHSSPTTPASQQRRDVTAHRACSPSSVRPFPQPVTDSHRAASDGLPPHIARPGTARAEPATFACSNPGVCVARSFSVAFLPAPRRPGPASAPSPDGRSEVERSGRRSQAGDAGIHDPGLTSRCADSGPGSTRSNSTGSSSRRPGPGRPLPGKANRSGAERGGREEARRKVLSALALLPRAPGYFGMGSPPGRPCSGRCRSLSVRFSDCTVQTARSSAVGVPANGSSCVDVFCRKSAFHHSKGGRTDERATSEPEICPESLRCHKVSGAVINVPGRGNRRFIRKWRHAGLCSIPGPARLRPGAAAVGDCVTGNPGHFPRVERKR